MRHLMFLKCLILLLFMGCGSTNPVVILEENIKEKVKDIKEKTGDVEKETKVEVGTKVGTEIGVGTKVEAGIEHFDSNYQVEYYKIEYEQCLYDIVDMASMFIEVPYILSSEIYTKAMEVFNDIEECMDDNSSQGFKLVGYMKNIYCCQTSQIEFENFLKIYENTILASCMSPSQKKHT